MSVFRYHRFGSGRVLINHYCVLRSNQMFTTLTRPCVTASKETFIMFICRFNPEGMVADVLSLSTDPNRTAPRRQGQIPAVFGLSHPDSPCP